MALSVYEELRAVIGPDAALQLVCKYGNQVIYLPKLDGTQGPSKEVGVIRELFHQDLDPLTIARRCNLSFETVVDVLEALFTVKE